MVNDSIILWLDICMIFLHASQEIHESIKAKLEGIKLIIDEIEKQRNFIKESFVPSDESCISKDVGAENAYTISPISNVEDDKKYQLLLEIIVSLTNTILLLNIASLIIL